MSAPANRPVDNLQGRADSDSNADAGVVGQENAQDATKGPPQVPVAERRKPRLEHAPVVTLIFVAGAALAFGTLLWLTNRPGPGKQGEFVGSVSFHSWTAIAAIAVVAFFDSIISGVVALSGQPATPPPGSGLRARATGLRKYFATVVRSAWRGTWPYVICYLVFAGIAIGVLLLAGKGGPDVPVHGWRTIVRTLLGLGCVAAAPWVLVVWMTHDEMTRKRETLGKLPTFGVKAAVPGDDTEKLDRTLNDLLQDRRTIYAAVTRLMVVVLAALFMSGALRAALVAWPPTKDALPAADVLLYGAFFAVALGLAVIPLLRAWRNTAQAFVDQVYPPSVATTADADSARARLLAVLDLNGSLFRSPIALSSILAPLVTSLLAAFIPKVSG